MAAFPDVARLAEAGTVDRTFGFFHGMLEAMGAYASDAELGELLADTCQAIYVHRGNSVSIRNACSHGAGHAAMWRSGTDFTLARDVCSVFEVPLEVDECVSGAVMEWASANRRAALSGEEAYRPTPYVADPFDLCYPPHGEPTPGCFGGAILAVERSEVAEKAARCLGAGMGAEDNCRNYVLVSIRNLHPESYEEASVEVARLCLEIPWASGPEQCYRNFGYLVMVSTISLREVETGCSFAPRKELFEACVNGAGDAETVLPGG